MKVIALKSGFHDGSLRNPGDEFEVADGAKAAWFAPVGAAPKAEKPKAKKDEPKALSELHKDNGKAMTDVLA